MISSKLIRQNKIYWNRVSHILVRYKSTLANDKNFSVDDDQIAKKLYGDVVPKIGLEIHAQLKVNSKLFSQGSASKDMAPNSDLDLLDIALPGSLPKLNQQALRGAILTSLGLNCTIQDRIHFDRKNYFYSDMPAGYQITQYNRPIAQDGFIDFIVATYHNSVIAHSEHYDLQKYLYESERIQLEDFEPYMKRSKIKQVQLEQDSAKTLHDDDTTNKHGVHALVDYNRSGIALAEIVFEPDLSNHHEASSLIKELICILKLLGTCDCELQEGSLRVDANVSIKSIAGRAIVDSGKVELKNLNSLRSVNRALQHEITRQADLLRSGTGVAQESRTYDTRAHKTVPLRAKETTMDYRYVPEPNIPPITIDSAYIGDLRQNLSSKTLPCNARDKLVRMNIDLRVISELVDEPGLSNYLLDILDTRPNYVAAVLADFLIYSISNLKNIAVPSLSVDLSTGSEFLKKLNLDLMCSILDMVFDEEISFHTAYELMKHYYLNDDSTEPRAFVESLDWFQIRNRDEVMQICDQVIPRMKSISKKYKKTGNKIQLRLMLNKISELTRNKVSIRVAIDCINDRLKPPDIQQ